MAFEIIPTSGDSSYSQTTSFSGSDFLLDFDYTARDGTHLMNLSLVDETLLIGGLALLPGRLELEGFQVEGLPEGDLVVIADRDIPELGDFGTGAAILVYATDEDLEEIEAILAG